MSSGVKVKYCHFSTIDSTNEEAKRISAENPKGPVVITADSQTKGRGQKGRTWHSELGGLYYSLLVTGEGLPLGNVPDLVRRIAMAIIKVLEEVSGVKPELEWPNDIILQDKKNRRNFN